MKSDDPPADTKPELVRENFVPRTQAAQLGAALPARVESPIAREALSRFTAARVGLGRAGSSLTTRAHLDFVGDHARARDAVWTAVDFDALARSIGVLGLSSIRLHSRASSRAEYLRRPDLGRVLDDDSAARVAALASSSSSRVAVVIADGLSAEAVQVGAVPVLDALMPLLSGGGYAPSTVLLMEQGRVASGDPVGEALGAEVVVVLIGERPGLSASDSLGCYLTWSPRTGTPDSKRNCISNIRAGGLAPEAAAPKIARLVRDAITRRLSGVELRSEEEKVPIAPGGV